jgi:hypothetical protein
MKKKQFKLLPFIVSMNLGLNALVMACDLVLVVATICITIFSFKLYHRFHKKSYLQFSTAFLFVTIGYLSAALLDITTLLHVSADVSTLFAEIWYIAVLMGLILFIYLYYEIDHLSLRLLLGALLAAAFLLGGADDFDFLVLCTVLFVFIVLKLYMRYCDSPDHNRLLVLIGFILLFIAKLLSGVMQVHIILFVARYLFKMVGALLIAYALWAVSR